MLKLGLLLLATSCVLAWKKEMENPNLFNGDMHLEPDQRKALFDDKVSYGSIIGHRWPNAEVPYVISSKMNNYGRNAIAAAIADYNKYTCVRWRPRRRGERGSYVYMIEHGGCSSWVGYVPNARRDLHLGQGCKDKGTAIHEMGHAIGLYHEQNRPDRDKYITIHRNNVQSGMYYNFQIENDVNSLGTPYDLRSIMHYSSTSFARNYQYRTISTKDPSKQKLIDHGDRLMDFSPTDILQINLMYNCGNVKPPPTTLPPPGACINKEKECEWWARTGWCDDKQEKQYMQDNCCQACKDFRCANNDKQCDYWQSIGECHKNPNWMLRNCRRSCKQCTP